MSSMRNAVQRRNHKERAQPLERQKWGILEKHKDYSLRAKDHNEKKRRLKALRNKVSERNPDEFAFGMVSSKTKNGIKIAQRGAENGSTGNISMDVAKLLKTQDAGYLQTILQQTRKEKERVQKDAVLAEIELGPGQTTSLGRRQVFAEDGEVVGELLSVDKGDEGSSGEVDEMSEDGKLPKEEIQAKRRKRRTQDTLQSRLDALTAREKQLDTALTQLEHQRAKMNNNVGGVNKDGVKFKVRERKR